jgi:hypothetical protein
MKRICLGRARVSRVGDGVSPSRTFLETCFGETPKPTSETLALPRSQMALFAYSVGFGEPGRDFVIDFANALEAKGVQMISRGESFDAAEARVLQPTRQDDVAVDPILPDDERSETHPDLERDPGFFGEDDHRSTPLCDRQQFVEDRADALRLSCKMRCERVAASARM